MAPFPDNWGLWGLHWVQWWNWNFRKKKTSFNIGNSKWVRTPPILSAMYTLEGLVLVPLSVFLVQWYGVCNFCITCVRQDFIYCSSIKIQITLIWRYPSVESLSHFNPSAHGKSFYSGISLGALFCTFSMAVMSLFKWGAHTWCAYSKCGLIRATCM